MFEKSGGKKNGARETKQASLNERDVYLYYFNL